MRGGLVLAGGLGTRMGVRKALLTLDTEPFIVIIIRTLLKVTDEVVVSIGFKDDPSTYQKIIPPSVKVVLDEVEAQSPIIGISAGLSQMRSTYTVILACDLPFAKAQVLEYLFKRADGFDAVIPRWPDGRIEPLHAVYRVNTALKAARKAVSSGGLKNTDMIERLARINHVDVNDIRNLDQELLSFFNINTPEDLMKAKQIVSEDRH